MTKVAQRYIRRNGHETKNDPHTAIADMLNDTHKQYRTSVVSDVQDGTSDNVQGCKLLCDFISLRPICETYVLSLNDKRHFSAITSKSYASAIIEELKDVEPGRFAILVLSNCKDIEECNKKALSEFGFVPRPKKAYRHYRKFSNAARKLIEESIEYFEAPCCKLFEYLKQQGFTGDHVTYP